MPCFLVCFLKYMPHFIDKCFYRLEAFCHLSKTKTLLLTSWKLFTVVCLQRQMYFKSLFYISSLFFKCIVSPTLLELTQSLYKSWSSAWKPLYCMLIKAMSRSGTRREWRNRVTSQSSTWKLWCHIQAGSMSEWGAACTGRQAASSLGICAAVPQCHHLCPERWIRQPWQFFTSINYMSRQTI